MKNILNVVNVYFAVPYFFGSQFKYLKSLGYDIHLICSPSEHLDKYASEQDIKYKEIPVTRSITPFIDLKSLIRICKYINDNKIQTIVGHTAKGSLLAVIAGRIMRVPQIIIFRHGIPYDRYKGIKKKLAICRTKMVSFLAHKIVCVSPSLAKLSLEINLNRPDKQFVLGKGTCGGINTESKFNPSRIDLNLKKDLKKSLSLTETDFVIGYCGRLSLDKGIVELLDSFEILQEKYPNKKLKLLLVGMFDERNPLSRKDKKRILNNDDIKFTGYVKDDLEYYYSLMKIAVLASYHEGFGMCMLEAQAMNVPVLTSSSIGCVDSIIENETGFYINIEPSDISSKIETYFNEQVRLKMGINARKFVVDNFDHKVIWPEIVKVYEC